MAGWLACGKSKRSFGSSSDEPTNVSIKNV
jgi:hypothetical protein